LPAGRSPGRPECASCNPGCGVAGSNKVGNLAMTTNRTTRPTCNQTDSFRDVFVTDRRAIFPVSERKRQACELPSSGKQRAAMPKQAITIPALRAGRKVRWLFEVSADVGEGFVRTKKTTKKHTRSKRTTSVLRKKLAQRRSHMDTDSRSTSRPSPPPLAPPPPSRTSNREIVVAVAIGVVSIAGLTMALVGFPSSQVASETRHTTVTESARSNVVAQSLESAAPVHVAPPVREAAAPVQAPKSIVEKSGPTPSATTRSSAAEHIVWPPPSMKAAPMVGPQAPDTTSEPSTRASSSAAQASAASQSATISGCLEMTVNGDQFRLTDTDGTDAPKARSWKSGFLKKGSASVDLVDFSEGSLLRQYVGHRVVATGLLSGRQLRLRSIQSGGSSCE
jgi:hypothetical protein